MGYLAAKTETDRDRLGHPQHLLPHARRCSARPRPASTTSPAAARSSASAPPARRSSRAGTACPTTSRSAAPARSSTSCRMACAASCSTTTASTTVPLPAGQGTGLGKPLKLLNHPVRDRRPDLLAALGDKNVELTAEIADGWLPILFMPGEGRRRLGRAARSRARPSASADLAPLEVVAGGMCAIGEGAETKALLDFARPMVALYIGGMGARGQNFYNDLVRRYGFEDEAKRDPGPLPRRQEGGGRGRGPARAAGADQPRRPGVVREGADRRLPRGRRHQPADPASRRGPGRAGRQVKELIG